MITHSHLETAPKKARIDYPTVTSRPFEALLALQKAVDESGLERSLLDLVKTRASQLNGCAFCIDMHVRDARQLGETEERLYMLAGWREATCYTERERAALLWTELLTRLPDAGVSDHVYAVVQEHFTDVELASLSFALVTINAWNRLNVGFRMPPGAHE